MSLFISPHVCVVALEGSQRHREEKERFVIWQHKFHVINAASLRSAVFEMFTREASTALEQYIAQCNLEKGLEESEYAYC